MPRSEKFANPFYGLLLVAGIVFAVTAVAYGVMMVQDNQAAQAANNPNLPPPNHPLMVWMRAYGEAALLSELALLAVFVFAAIGTDDYWQRRRTEPKNTDQGY